MLKIYWADADVLRPVNENCLSGYRRRSISGVKNEQVKKLSLCAETLLIKALQIECCDIPLPLLIEADEYGKPYLRGQEFSFNISHSSHFAACALADYPVGLDLQIRTAARKSLIRRFFSEAEQEAIFGTNEPDSAFTRLWCRKESFLKAIGIGLRLELASFDLSDFSQSFLYAGTEYMFHEFQRDDLFFCICAQQAHAHGDYPPEIICLT